MSEASQTGQVTRRVVVTGLGAVTPLGHSAEALWKGCLSGCSGAGPITLFDTSAYTTRFAAEVKDWVPRPTWTKKRCGAWTGSRNLPWRHRGWRSTMRGSPSTW